MNLNEIANRITELLSLKGFTEKHAVDELTDHYLTHIEEEIKRGVNAQQAVRETFQDIANINLLEFSSNKKKNHSQWILLLLILLLGMVYQWNTKTTSAESNIITKASTNPDAPKEVTTYEINPPSGMPIDQSNFSITSNFGFRIHPVNQQKQLHRGIDIKAKLGTPVLAAGDGTVLEAGYKEKPGKYIVIQHKGNYTTKYYHLSDFSVVTGTPVTKGQIIGKVGNSGMSFMPHLHYEILKNDFPVNPREIIKP